MSEDPGHLSEKVDHLAEFVRAGLKEVTATLTEFRIGLERRLAAIDVKQGVLESVNRHLVQVGEHRARIAALEIGQRHNREGMAILFFCLVAVLVYLKFLP